MRLLSIDAVPFEASGKIKSIWYETRREHKIIHPDDNMQCLSYQAYYTVQPPVPAHSNDQYPWTLHSYYHNTIAISIIYRTIIASVHLIQNKYIRGIDEKS